MQLDRRFTTEEVEQEVLTFYRNANFTAADATLTPIDTKTPFFGHKDTEVVAMVWLDCIVCLASLLVAVLTLAIQRHMIEATDINTITIADYSVHLAGIPSGATAEQVLRLTLQPWSPVWHSCVPAWRC